MRTVPDAALLGLMPLDMRARFGDVEGPIRARLASGEVLVIPNGRLSGRGAHTVIVDDPDAPEPPGARDAALKWFTIPTPLSVNRIRCRLRGCDCEACRARGIVNP